jgi:hypothetical protein
MYRPHTLAHNFESFLKEFTDKERSMSLEVDRKVLSGTDSEAKQRHLDELKEKFHKSAEIKENLLPLFFS